MAPDNFFLFGLTNDQVYAKKSEGYKPQDFYDSNAELKQTLDELGSGRFSRGDTSLFRPILDTLLYRDDPYMLLADYQSYIECQDEISQAYLDKDRWTRMSILNTARMGKFSSDRAIREYCSEIWSATPVKVEASGLTAFGTTPCSPLCKAFVHRRRPKRNSPFAPACRSCQYVCPSKKKSKFHPVPC